MSLPASATAATIFLVSRPDQPTVVRGLTAITAAARNAGLTGPVVAVVACCAALHCGYDWDADARSDAGAAGFGGPDASMAADARSGDDKSAAAGSDQGAAAAAGSDAAGASGSAGTDGSGGSIGNSMQCGPASVALSCGGDASVCCVVSLDAQPPTVACVPERGYCSGSLALTCDGRSETCASPDVCCLYVEDALLLYVV